MFALQRTWFGVSRRDAGAGLVAGVAALLAAVLFNAAILARYYGLDPAGVATYRQQSLVPIIAIAIVPLLALAVGTFVWRTVVPESSTPGRGAVAGVLTAFGTLLVFATLFGIFAGLGELTGGSIVAPLAAFSSFVNITVVVFLFGAFFTAMFIAPLGAVFGYAYEWALARRRDASLRE